MTTPQMRRIQTLEDRQGGTELTQMIAYVASANGITVAAVIAEAERLLEETAGLTEAERNARLAADLGKTIAEIETARAEVAAEFAAWQRARTP